MQKKIRKLCQIIPPCTYAIVPDWSVCVPREMRIELKNYFINYLKSATKIKRPQVHQVALYQERPDGLVSDYVCMAFLLLYTSVQCIKCVTLPYITRVVNLWHVCQQWNVG